MQPKSSLPTGMGLYALLNYPVVLLALWPHLDALSLGTARATAFGMAVYVVYGALYTLLIWAVARLGAALLVRVLPQRRAFHLSLAFAVLLFAALSLALLVDGQLYRLYGFHLNGFVWNLITTPGGLESMGMSNATGYTAVLLMLAIALGQAVLAFIAWQFLQPRWLRFDRRRPLKRAAVALFVMVALAQHAVFGIAHMHHDAPIVLAAKAFPLYQPITFRKLAKKAGYEVPERKAVRVASDHAQLAYPASGLQVEQPAQPFNIVWLVAESWRWDMLDPAIMPHTAAFAARATQFERHYSGGNGTRMGLFSMFFGLYGNYWFPMLAQRRGPVLIDALQQQGYDIRAYTSAKFSYPEFDKTIFSQLPGSALHEDPAGPTWMRDQRNVNALLADLEQRDRSRPFMRFMFFESPHARYEFPPDAAIRQPYLENFNYATMDLERDIGLIKNRYINACHHLDQQFARVFEYLEREQLLDRTIVILTGDHGEEFMEKGRWGHNSDFSEEQVRVPLVLHMPGRAPQTVTHLTSHLDLPATLLPRLGVRNAASDYSLGHDLFDPAYIRKYTVFASWTELGYRDEVYKATFPREGGNVFGITVETANDVPVDDPDEFYATRQLEMAQLLRDTGRFSRAQARPEVAASAAGF